MELRHLRYLVMVAEESHFTRAAQRLRIAQPALSQQIRRLEAEVGLPLVERTTRRVRLTEAGRLLVEQARRVLVEADHAVTVLDDLRGLRAGRVAIGASQTMASVDLSRLLATFHRSFPAVEMVVQEDFSLELASALRGDELDLAFITVSGPGDGLEARAVATEPLVCIAPPEHVLAQRAHIDLRDVEEESFIAFRRGATIRQTIEAATGERGFVPRVMFETNNVSRMRALVSTGLGIAVPPQTDAARMGDSVATVPFSGVSLTHTVYLSWRENRRHSPAAQAFVDLVLATADSFNALRRRVDATRDALEVDVRDACPRPHREVHRHPAHVRDASGLFGHHSSCGRGGRPVNDARAVAEDERAAQPPDPPIGCRDVGFCPYEDRRHVTFT